jgi:hypothetical protein
MSVFRDAKSDKPPNALRATGVRIQKLFIVITYYL